MPRPGRGRGGGTRCVCYTSSGEGEQVERGGTRGGGASQQPAGWRDASWIGAQCTLEGVRAGIEHAEGVVAVGAIPPGPSPNFIQDGRAAVREDEAYSSVALSRATAALHKHVLTSTFSSLPGHPQEDRIRTLPQAPSQQAQRYLLPTAVLAHDRPPKARHRFCPPPFARSHRSERDERC